MKLVKIILLLVILSINMCISSEVSNPKGDENKVKKSKRNNLDHSKNNLSTSNPQKSQSQTNLNNNNLNNQSNQSNINNQVNQPNLNTQVNQPNQSKNNLGNLENLNQNDKMNNRNSGNLNNQVDRNNFNHQHNPNGKEDYNNQSLNKNNLNNQQNQLKNNNLNHKNQKDPFKVNHQGGYSPKVQPIWFNHFRWSWVYGIPSYSRKYILAHRSLCLDVCERREVMCNGSDVVTEYDLTTGFLKCVCTNDRSKALVDNEYCWTPRKCVLAVENVGCTPILNAIFQKKKDLGYDDEI